MPQFSGRPSTGVKFYFPCKMAPCTPHNNFAPPSWSLLCNENDRVSTALWKVPPWLWEHSCFGRLRNSRGLVGLGRVPLWLCRAPRPPPIWGKGPCQFGAPGPPLLWPRPSLVLPTPGSPPLCGKLLLALGGAGTSARLGWGPLERWEQPDLLPYHGAKKCQLQSIVQMITNNPRQKLDSTTMSHR